MIFSQHYLDCLSQSSYLVGDESTGRAVVVDPRRDVGVYLDEAAAHGLRIERVIATHVHADFLTGHLELAARAGAVVSFGEGVEAEFPIEWLRDGQRLSLGRVTLEVMATPGHTPESICVVVYERPDDEVPYGVLTGDTLFVGDVGRPDLLVAAGTGAVTGADGGAATGSGGAAGASADALGRQLYRSLHGRLMGLPDPTRVFPAHGPGSACGRQISTETSSTLGQERRTNPALQPMSEDEFVVAVSGGQPPQPPYFSFDARRNREARPLLDHRPSVALDLGEVLDRQRAGAVLLDTRSHPAFAAGHLRDAVNIGLDGRFAEAAGSVLAHDRDIVLVGPSADAAEARVRLGRIGYDRVVGRLAHPGQTRQDLIEVSQRLTVAELVARRRAVPALQLIDVRNPSETAAGTLPGARLIPLATLIAALPTLDPTTPVVLCCASGYRSQVAASVLQDGGFTDVGDLLGGYTAWLAADPLNCELAVPSLSSNPPGGTTPPAFYIRNHFPVPSIDAAAWRLNVAGLVDRPLRLSLAELRTMPGVELTVTVECAGNGRTAMEPRPDGEPWGLGAVSTAIWTGVPLSRVLDQAGVVSEGRHAVMRGADTGQVDGEAPPVRYERGMAIDEIRGSGALLAYAMNHGTLEPRHGFPVRLVVPGWYGMASVKWLTDIDVVSAQFEGHFQTSRYVYETERDGERVVEPVRLQRVRSVITDPADGADLASGDLVVRGLAWSGAAAIAAVEVSVDGGPWQGADLEVTGERGRWAWQSWQLRTRLNKPGPVTLRARATDGLGHTQPHRPSWNRHGYGANHIHQVHIHVAGPA